MTDGELHDTDPAALKMADRTMSPALPEPAGIASVKVEDRTESSAETVPGPETQVRYLFPKSARMPAGGPYSRVFQGRKVVSDATISLHVGPNGLAWHRLGLGVAKKMFRRAVARNRIKRLIREAFRLERHAFAGGLDIVIRPKVRELTLEGLRASIRTLVPKAQRKFGQAPLPVTDPIGSPTSGDGSP